MAIKSSGRRAGGRAARSDRPAIALTDIGIIAGLLVMTPLAWCLPRRWWPKLGAALSPAISAYDDGGTGRAIAGNIERFTGERPLPMPVDRIVARGRSGYFEEFLSVLRCYRPWDRTPRCVLEGGEHLKAALEGGRGAVLWIGDFQFYSLVSKVALYQAGFPTVHLSHPTHGFSKTRFGIAVLNPIKKRAEDAYLNARASMAFDGPTAALRTLQRRLRKNGIVSLTARAEGQAPVSVRFLDGEIDLATGAPDVAFVGRAPLLPVHTVYLEDGTFRVTVAPPIEADRSAGRRAFSEAAASAYASSLEPVVLSHPHQWRAWFRM